METSREWQRRETTLSRCDLTNYSAAEIPLAGNYSSWRAADSSGRRARFNYFPRPGRVINVSENALMAAFDARLIASTREPFPRWLSRELSPSPRSVQLEGGSKAPAQRRTWPSRGVRRVRDLSLLNLRHRVCCCWIVASSWRGGGTGKMARGAGTSVSDTAEVLLSRHLAFGEDRATSSRRRSWSGLKDQCAWVAFAVCNSRFLTVMLV